MRLSDYFMPILKENPAEAKIASHRLMLRAGMIRQLSSGIYNWLPLGLRVLRKIEGIIRQELENIGVNELLMPTIQPLDLWKESGRGGYGEETLKVIDRHNREMIYGPTNEEVITDIFRKNVKSYKDLPLNLYHIQWKFRDEIRPRFGVMRGREFLMKDAYSFDISEEKAIENYKKIYLAYLRIFKKMDLRAIPFEADAGLIGGKLTHEFQVIANTGESEIYYDEKYEELLAKDEIDIDELFNLDSYTDETIEEDKKSKLKKSRGIEVGHIFYLDDKYSKPMKAYVANKDGVDVPVKMGAYGIGVSRLVGAIIEAHHDENGIVFPESVAPFKYAIINLKNGDTECDKAAEDLYNLIGDVLYDDRSVNAGTKFAAMDLIGIPYQITIGPRGIKEGKYELKNRKTGHKELLTKEELLSRI